MPRNALALLPEADRAVVVRWLFELGLEADELHACPPLRQAVEMVAAASVVRSMCPPATREAAWEAASAMVGRRSLLRRWYEYQRRALECCAESAGERDECDSFGSDIHD